MSKAAYEGYFGKQAPSGAYFGADVSWYQGAGSYSDTMGYWQDFNTWASWVNIRTSYGRSGDDGNQGLHFQCANDIGFRNGGRTLGTYHYVIPTSGVDGNFNNYISRSDPFVSVTTHDMLDFEEGPNPGNGFINEFCDRVEQRRQRPCLIYAGKSYLDGAGPINCPVEKVWVAHYPGRGATAWSPTTDWSSWGAPLMPNQYGDVVPGCWQWSSTAIGYSLDLDITTTPHIFGIGGTTVEDDMFTDEDRGRLNWLFSVFNDGQRWGQLWNAAGQTDNLWHWINDGNRLQSIYENAGRAAAIAERMNTDLYVKDSAPNGSRNLLRNLDQLPGNLKGLSETIAKFQTGGIDIEALASSIAVALGPKTIDYEKVRALVREELGRMNVTLSIDEIAKAAAARDSAPPHKDQ
jgi:hypothetical protein